MPAAHGQADDHGPVHPDGVQHGDRVIDVLTVAVGLRGPGTAGPAIAPALNGDHPEVARQVRHLGLPLPGVHDGPGGEQQDGWLARAEHLIADLDAVPLDEALDVGIPRPHGRLR
jgi:hypothetical protein